MWRSILMVTLVLFSGIPFAWATPPEGEPIMIDSSGRDIAWYPMETFVSNPGEGKIDFLRRVGLYEEVYTFRSKFETCGEIWSNKDQTRWAVPVGTIHAHVGCIITSVAPQGEDWVVTGETIHAHPHEEIITANAIDALVGNHADGKSGPVKEGEKVYLHRSHFSPGDLDAGPGYLAYDRGLQYQSQGGKIYETNDQLKN